MSLLCVENFDSAPWSLLKLSPINRFQKENLLKPGLTYLQPRHQGAFSWLCRWRPRDEVVLFSSRKKLSQTNKAGKLIIALYPVLMEISSSSYLTFSFSLFFISYNLKFQPSVILFHVLKPIQLFKRTPNASKVSIASCFWSGDKVFVPVTHSFISVIQRGTERKVLIRTVDRKKAHNVFSSCLACCTICLLSLRNWLCFWCSSRFSCKSLFYVEVGDPR